MAHVVENPNLIRSREVGKLSHEMLAVGAKLTLVAKNAGSVRAVMVPSGVTL